METYTFVLDFEGGTYVAQVQAASWLEAPREWAKGFEGPPDWSAADAHDLTVSLNEDLDDLMGPVPLSGMTGVYQAFPTVRGGMLVVTYVRTLA